MTDTLWVLEQAEAEVARLQGIEAELTTAMSDLETAQDLATRYHDSLMAATGSIVAFEEAAAQYITVGSKTEAEIINAVWDNGWDQAAEALDTFGELALLRGVNAITTDEIAALVQDAKEVNDWKSLQAAIDAGSTISTGSVSYGVGDVIEEGAVHVNGASAIHFETADNSDAATVIFGSMEVNGELVSDVVVYSSNSDLISVGDAKSVVEANFDVHGDRNPSNFISIVNEGGAQFIVEERYTSATNLATLFDAGTTKLDAYVEGYKDGYSEGYDDGFSDGYEAGWNDRDSNSDKYTTKSSR